MTDTHGTARGGIGGAAAMCLFVALGGGVLYSALRIHDLTFDLDELRQKVGRKSAASAATTAPAVTVLPSSAPQGADLSGEVERLRGEIEALKASLGAQSASTSATLVGAAGPTFATAPDSSGGTLPEPLMFAMESMTEDQRTAFKKSVLAIVDEREKEREAKKQERKKNEIVEQLAAKLGLTDAQRDRVQTTVDQAAARITELRKLMNDGNQDQVRNEIRTTMKTADDGIRLLLTAEQATMYDQWKTEQNPRQLFGMGGGGGGKNKDPKTPQR